MPYSDEYPDEIKAQTLMLDDNWQWLFSPEGLTPFCPEIGDVFDSTPIVEVWYVDSKLTKHCAVMVLAMMGEEEPTTEMQHRVFATLGEEWAKERWMVYAARFACMSMIAVVEQDEPRPASIEHHPRMQRARLVSGLTIDGRSATAWAELRVGKKRVKRVKPWDVHVTCDPQGPMLAVPHLLTAFAAYGRKGLRSVQPRDASRN